MNEPCGFVTRMRPTVATMTFSSQALVDDAVEHGAKVGAGGEGAEEGGAQFYKPTVILIDDGSAASRMRLMKVDPMPCSAR